MSEISKVCDEKKSVWISELPGLTWWCDMPCQAIFIRVAMCAVVIWGVNGGNQLWGQQPPGKTPFPTPFNTEAEGQHPPSPEEMVKLIEVPDGFQVTLFAGEPDVQQPICMDFDDRGRLWVAENYSYSGGPYETKLRDRIVILEDTDGDGRHDSRKVFWDDGFMLTSLTWGFGGLWVLHDGTLSLILDRNGDDVPDGEPVVMLDGWSKDCGHNFVSGLIWGPDGWLYGRHGIVDTSYPGVPGTPADQRVAMNCGIWRFHPTKHTVEVVCNGTTNPWGLDYNKDGQFFMTNNVQGHLWHVIPGAHFQRMYGQDFNPHAYELMGMTADHYHWDTSTKWNESRDGVANDLGGGHSHVGGLIYHGANFPKQYHDKIFMCNTHGRRLNVNRLERHGSGYVGRREPDFMLVHNPWFRGVDIKMGPDGAVYVSDWSDNGECHDHDGIHRTSGRIYKIAFGTPQLTASQKSVLAGNNRLEWLNSDWINRGDWFGRHARRIRQELVAEGELSGRSLAAAVSHQTPLLLLYSEAFGGVGKSELGEALRSENSDVVAQAIQLANSDPQRQKAHAGTVEKLASSPQPANVLLSLVSVMQKMDVSRRWSLVKAVFSCPENAATIEGEDQLRLMAWYGIEPVAVHEQALGILDANPRLQQFAVRRCAYESASNPEVAGRAIAFIARKATEAKLQDYQPIADLLVAYRQGLAGRARVNAPQGWGRIEDQLRATKNKDVLLQLDALSVLFGDGAALAELRALAADGNTTAVSREQAIAALAQAADKEAVPVLFRLLSDRAVADAAIRALRDFDHPQIAQELLNRFDGFRDGNKSLAIDTLSSRESYALELTNAVEAGRIAANEMTAAQVRQLLAFNNQRMRDVLESKWGTINETPEARLAAIQKWKVFLTPERLAAADLDSGAEIFKKACATCHKLYGEGSTIGPDLTGSNRGNLDYLLMNMIDPSAVVPREFTTSVLVLKSGRVIVGVIVGETDQILTVQTQKEALSIAATEIDERQSTFKSLMPDGLLDNLTEQQVRDLFGFMMLRR